MLLMGLIRLVHPGDRDSVATGDAEHAVEPGQTGDGIVRCCI